MASKYKVWVDYANVADNTSAFDSQQQTGFKGGTVASAKRVNTILRQNSLVVSGLMEIIDSQGTTDYSSPIANVQTLMQSYFGGFVPSTRKVAGKALNTDINLGTLTLKMNGVQQGQVYDGATNREVDFTDVASKSEVDTQFSNINAKKVYVHQIHFSRYLTTSQTGYMWSVSLILVSATISAKCQTKTAIQNLVNSENTLLSGIPIGNLSIPTYFPVTGIVTNIIATDNYKSGQALWFNKDTLQILWVQNDSPVRKDQSAFAINFQTIDPFVGINILVNDNVDTITLGDLT